MGEKMYKNRIKREIEEIEYNFEADASPCKVETLYDMYRNIVGVRLYFRKTEK